MLDSFFLLVSQFEIYPLLCRGAIYKVNAEGREGVLVYRAICNHFGRDKSRPYIRKLENRGASGAWGSGQTDELKRYS